jgi:hypothetical protein
MTEELNLSANQLDALREIGNVGAGNSATASQKRCFALREAATRA